MWLWQPQGTLRGIISCHVDDFLFSGGRQDSEWEALLRKIREKYASGEWESKRFVQCGVLIEEQEDNSYHLSQPSYVDKVHEIPISASRLNSLGEFNLPWAHTSTCGTRRPQLACTAGSSTFFS